MSRFFCSYTILPWFNNFRAWSWVWLRSDVFKNCVKILYWSLPFHRYLILYVRQNFVVIRFCLGLTIFRAWPWVWLRSDVLKNRVEMFHWSLPFHRYLILYVPTKFCSYTILPWEYIRAHPKFLKRLNIFKSSPCHNRISHLCNKLSFNILRLNP